ncbi:ABC-2 family transporter protein [Haloimpatiens sp. FM7315]|uniref:ABC-2 family transporter protein n=1 Tax=Haloimpatiens sp. FM7315 TaxID=3298609 RepID=UPI00370C0105
MKKYFTAVVLSLKDYKYFSLDFFYGLLAIPIQVCVIYLFWKYSLNNTKILSYTASSLGKYFIYTNVLQLSFLPAMFVTYETWDSINKGEISLWIVKPLNYPLYIFSKKFGNFIFKFIICMFVFSGIEIIFKLNFSYKSLILGIVLSILGFIILFQIQFLIGICTFWVGKVLTLRDNIMNLTFLFGGQLLPINMLPRIISNISKYLPMQYIYYLPANVLSNNFSINEISFYIKIEVIWIIIFFIATNILWNLGIKRYSPNGG